MKKKRHIYTRSEVDFICNFWRDKSDAWMAAKLGVDRDSYKAKRLYLGFVKSPYNKVKGHRKVWTFTQEEFLKEHYGKSSTKEIAAHLGKSWSSVLNKAYRLGLSGQSCAWNQNLQPLDLRDEYYK